MNGWMRERKKERFCIYDPQSFAYFCIKRWLCTVGCWREICLGRIKKFSETWYTMQPPMILTDSEKSNINQEIPQRRNYILPHLFLHLLRVHFWPKSFNLEHCSTSNKLPLRIGLYTSSSPAARTKPCSSAFDLLIARKSSDSYGAGRDTNRTTRPRTLYAFNACGWTRKSHAFR